MKTSEQTEAISAAIIAFQSEIGAIAKSKEVVVKHKGGGQHSFKYAPLDAIAETIKPLMAKNCLAFMQPVDMDCITTRIIHTSGQWMESETFLNRQHASMQDFGGEISFKRRYSLSAILGIVTDEGNDEPHYRHSPTQGSLEGLPQRRQNFLADLAEIIKDKHSEGNEYGAYEEYIQIDDQDERVALWSLLPSKVRSCLTKLNVEEREKSKAA